MSDLLETIDRIDAERASIGRLFNRDDGTPMRRLRRNTPEYLDDLAEAGTLVDAVFDGRRPMHYLEEAMTTSDFPLLFGDIIDRQLLANYRETPQTFREWAHIGSVRDFRSVRRFTISGGEARLQKVGTVPEETEYPYEKLAEARFTYSVAKYGKKFRFSWEAMVNDDLDALKDTPARMGRSARRTEEYFATALLFGATGPNTTFFAAGNSNVVTSNPTLTISAIQTAFQILAAQTDPDGEPIVIDMVHLLVPPALYVPAMTIVNATEIWDSSGAGGGATGRELHVANWMKNIVKVHVNPYIPQVSATSNGNTSWVMVADPGNGRPALEVGFLRGHESPELFMKSPNATRVGGGGLTDPMDGDFDTDSIEYKVRHVLGGTLLDPKMAVASNGSGS